MTAKLPKVPALDGFRAVAILIVMLSHGVSERIPGGLGVTIFFFLSGFLITSLLRLEAEQSGRISLTSFYYKRTLRIFPPMYITIAVAALLSAAGLTGQAITGSGLVTDALFLTNYAQQLGAGTGAPMPLWSLDVEEHFYILFSTLFAFVLVQFPARRSAVICALLALAILVVRFVIVLNTDDQFYVYYWSHTRIDSILWGCVLALWNNPAVDRDAWKPNQAHFGLALAVLLFCLVVRDEVFRETIRYTLQGGALFVVFSFAMQTKGIIAQVLASSPLRIVALLSYTLYLIHVPALKVAEHLGQPALVGLLASFAYAALMYIFVEKPIAGLRRRRRSDQSSAAVPSASS